jgi:hypothetical protein
VAPQLARNHFWLNISFPFREADPPRLSSSWSGRTNELTEFGIREFVTNKVIDVVDIDAPF